MATKKIRQTKVNEALRSWRDCNAVLSGLTEDEVKAALKHEQKNKRREQMLIRLHARFSAMRATREREEIINSVLGG